jgi:hypothetical protein
MIYYNCYGWFERPAPLLYYTRVNTTIYLLLWQKTDDRENYV